MAPAAKKRPSVILNTGDERPSRYWAGSEDPSTTPMVRADERGSWELSSCRSEGTGTHRKLSLRSMWAAVRRHDVVLWWLQIAVGLAIAGAIGFLITVATLFRVEISLISSTASASLQKGATVAFQPDLGAEGRFTVRINTFRRNDLLQRSVDHFATCACVHAIDVVWSDQANRPPKLDLFSEAARQLVHFEEHPEDSLNNRFRPLAPVATEAVFSVDDDLLMSCVDLENGFAVWRSAKRAMVGFVPRLVTADADAAAAAAEPGNSAKLEFSYRSWWFTWWSGLYNVVLTKACFLHRDHLTAYFEVMPRVALEYIDVRRNCEDLAMAFVVAREAKAPPIWVPGRLTELGGSEGISSAHNHFKERGDCVNYLAEKLGGFPLLLSGAKAVPARTLWFWW